VTIRVLIVDDHEVVRQGVAALLERSEDLQVIGEAADGRTAVAMAEKLLPDVVVMDLMMPSLNGIEATRRITSSLPGVNVVVLSMLTDVRYIREALRAGAVAYVPKRSDVSELVDAVRAAARGEGYLSSSITALVRDDYMAAVTQASPAPLSRLTPREKEVFQLLAEGKSAKQIGCELGVSVKTVSVHKRHLMSKLGLGGLADLVKLAIKSGVVSVED